MRLKGLLQRYLPHSSFVRSVSVLAGGTALAQGIGVLALPLITRIYTPEDFSILAIFTSIAAIASAAICLRLEIAIPIPEHDEDAVNLLILALGFCTLLSALLGIVLWVFQDEAINTLKQPNLKHFIWMLPLSIWLSGIYSAIQFWSTRKKRFTEIAKTKISQILSSTVTQIIFGISSALGATGLLIGQIASSGTGLTKLFFSAWKKDKNFLPLINQEKIRNTLTTYSRYPKYSSLEAIANIAAIQLPIVIIGATSTGPDAGYLLLAMKAAATPMGLIGNSISQVYLSHASLEYRKGQLKEFTLSIIDKLIKVGIGPIIFIGITSPTLVPLIFGEDWKKSGIMIAWMAPWFAIQFITSPISMALHVTGQQGISLLNQFIGFLLRVGLTFLASIFAKNTIFEWYAISGFIAYSIYFLAIAYSTKIKFQDLKVKFINQILYCSPWVLFALLLLSI